MRLSCSGCRVLRKGCGDDCSIRPCLEWIKSPESQANATVFLAKFYGRAGLMNLINAGPAHLRPAIFRSLLYESCGRIVNPIYGSVGLMWSGNWNLCNAAVEAVLKGAAITPMAATDAAEAKNGPPLKAYDIRHVNKEDNLSGSDRLRRVRTRARFKRSGSSKSKPSRVCIVEDDSQDEVNRNQSPSNESSLSHQSEAAASPALEQISRHSESLGSADTAEQEAEVERKLDDEDNNDGDEIELDLTLGLEPAKRCPKAKELSRADASGLDDNGGFCKMRLGLDSL